MSTILDALRKLEREKKTMRRSQARPVDDATAARELVSGRRGPASVEVSARHLLIGAGIAGLAIVAASVSLSVWVMAQPAGAWQAAAPQSAPALPPSVQAASAVAEPPQAAVKAVRETPQPPPLPTPAVAAPSAPPTPSVVPAAAPKPEPEPRAVAAVESRDVDTEPLSASSSPAPQDLAPAPQAVERPAEPYSPSQRASLPIMTETDRRRYGCQGMRINMVRPINNHNPHASAIINMTPVYVGETIPNTTVRILDVDFDGIVVEGVQSGRRYVIRVL